MFCGLCDYYWFIKVPAPVGWLGCSGALHTNREAAPVFTSARKSLSQLFDVFDRHPWKCWLDHVHSAPGPHSWVIRKQSSGLGSLAWVVLVNMTAAAWLGVMARGWAGNPRLGMKENNVQYSRTPTDPSHHMTGVQLFLLCLNAPSPKQKNYMRF